jgi:hypothetical protein
METVVIVFLAVLVAFVSIDAVARLDERRRPKRAHDPTMISTQKIIVDLSKRG